ncbi:hypothetical protein F2Q69_00026482 [Brassica cretica]|uniref:V-type proton ATPase subunit C n=1 Tax=Brassica cretica TaxID=69181 RepID=A0A8S9S7K5_BRACR|nr:hypothetical protein F2Q69_00026482 [Brassica cretica]
MTSRYWVVSLPVKEDSSSTTLWNRLQEQISKHSFDTPVYRFNIPNLRVGTLDSLLALGDDLLKVRVAEYNNVRGQLNAINRKQSGSLAVRDLSNLVKPEDVVTSEYLLTLLAVVPKYSQKDWLACYETLTDFVVPRSSKKLFEDNEYALYTVTLFTRVADNYRTSAREKGFQVSISSQVPDITSRAFLEVRNNHLPVAIRDFEHSVEAQETRKQELEKLVQDQESLRSSLLQWCYTSYGEVFSSWMHFCAVRIFAESIMRYGLPPAFLEDAGAMAGLAGDSETHPYVSFTINLA